MNTSIAISRLLMGASFGSVVPIAAGVDAHRYEADPRRDVDSVIALVEMTEPVARATHDLDRRGDA